jgi:hypothetical protein
MACGSRSWRGVARAAALSSWLVPFALSGLVAGCGGSPAPSVGPYLLEIRREEPEDPDEPHPGRRGRTKLATVAVEALVVGNHNSMWARTLWVTRGRAQAPNDPRNDSYATNWNLNAGAGAPFGGISCGGPLSRCWEWLLGGADIELLAKVAPGDGTDFLWIVNGESQETACRGWGTTLEIKNHCRIRITRDTVVVARVTMSPPRPSFAPTFIERDDRGIPDDYNLDYRQDR